MALIVTVDGPSGTGKSSVSRAVADRFGLPHLDTGAYYRAATAAVLDAGADPTDASGVLAIVEQIEIDQYAGATYLDGVDVSSRIRDADVTAHVSPVSTHAEVRENLVTRQRSWVERVGGSAVVEGRDIGSVVFPDAEVKVYLDARPEIRAARRAGESGEDAVRVAELIAARDRIDSTRSASPLTIPDEAVVIDTSDMEFEAVVEAVSGLIIAKS